MVSFATVIFEGSHCIFVLVFGVCLSVPLNCLFPWFPRVSYLPHALACCFYEAYILFGINLVPLGKVSVHMDCLFPR